MKRTVKNLIKYSLLFLLYFNGNQKVTLCKDNFLTKGKKTDHTEQNTNVNDKMQNSMLESSQELSGKETVTSKDSNSENISHLTEPDFPPVTHPYLLIDCGAAGEALKSQCFKQIVSTGQFIAESGLFSEVYSFSSLSVLARNEDRIFPFTISDRPPYENSGYRQETGKALYLNPAEYAQYLDSQNRYALIKIVCAEPANQCLETMNNAKRDEWKDRLDRAKIKSWFFDEPDFAVHHNIHFNTRLGTIRLEGWDPVSLTTPLFWENLSRLQRDLYRVNGVKQLYSPWHVMKNLAVLLQEPANTKDSLTAILEVWELAGADRSRRLRVENAIVYIDYYGPPGKPDIHSEVEKTLRQWEKRFGPHISWTIRPASGSEIRKTVDPMSP